MTLNKVTLIGNVGKHPEVRTTQNGRDIASFSLATSERWKDKNSGEKMEKTEWHRIVVFNDALVKIIKSYVRKGSKLYVEGSLHTRKWTDDKGIDRYTTDITIEAFNGTIKLLDSKEDRPADSQQEYANNQYDRGSYQKPAPKSAELKDDPEVKYDLDDEIPF